ncbi:SDR family oxidoreductase [Acidovorax sp. BLS4]|uniref:SDR family oxidoreductase n=1 Tax=Acidovorax sp. BLS4 TaxID=3273430 RepID=UPI0029424B04|nr:SDR family oxidoreductase [Paracidovorax avenae]WOI45780.1 SDR family oxidoreductase [Paracidovorax avenae]
MSTSSPRLLVTGANGQLGRLVIQQLLTRVPASQIVASVRNVEKSASVLPAGIELRQADYGDAASWDAALQGIDRVLLISSSEVGSRVAQHGNVIRAAARAGVQLIAYTSLLHADESPLGLALEHLATEGLLKESGVPFVLLRNGWYTENNLMGIGDALGRGVLVGASGEGRFASASRADYAAAAAAVLAAADGTAGKVYELAGDGAYTRAELAQEVARQAGKPLAYQDMPEAAYRDLLVSVGLPAPVAEMLADSDAGAARGGLFDGGRQLSALIGRPTTPLAASVAEALKA